MPNVNSDVQAPGEWRRYVAFSFATSDLLIELDSRNHIQFVTGATAELLGLPSHSLLDKDFLSLVSDLDRQILTDAIAALKPGHRLPTHTIGLTLSRSAIRLSGFRMPGDQSRVYLAASRIVLPSPRDEAFERDGATGLITRADFTELVEDQIELLQAAGEDAALTMMQFDDLEGLRQRIGPDRTAKLLRELGDALRFSSIGNDSAGMLADDKYGVVHAPSDAIVSLMAKASALVKKADPSGIAGFSKHTISLTHHELDSYEAAQAIRYAVNRFADADAHSFDVRKLEDGIEKEMTETVGRINALKITVRNLAFTLVFQPIVALPSREIHHYEALTRFPDGGSPFEIITFAEQVGMVSELDLGVASKARDFVRLHKNGNPIQVAVNQSARSIESDMFIEALRAELADEPALRPFILFEVTESYKVKNLERANNVIQQLRGDDHRVCLDDFGAGGASFDYIQILDVDMVKLDGVYIRRMLDSHRDICILEAMAGLCRKLDVETIAEFVETENQAAKLHEIGVQFGQGWLFGKPEQEPVRVIPGPPEAAPARPKQARQRRGEQVSWA